MDERRRKRTPAHGRPGAPRGQRPVKRSRRARRRRRNAIIRWMIFIVLVIAAAGGFLVWKKYGSSNEKADLEQYYDIGAEDEIAVVVNNEVIREDGDAAADDTSEAPPMPGRIYDGQYYIEYSVVRDRINERFYWDPNENVLLYTMPDGNVSVEVGSRDYTDVTEKKSADYDILKTVIEGMAHMEYAGDIRWRHDN